MDTMPRRARLTAWLHAGGVGMAWMPMAFVGMAGWGGTGLGEAVRSLPDPVQGALVAAVLLAALPLLWPVYLALGWYESGLAIALGRGDPDAAARLRRLVQVQAGITAVLLIPVTGLAVVAARAWRQGDATGHLVLTWLPLLALVLAHLATAWTVRPHGA